MYHKDSIKEEYDVWANHILEEDTKYSMGMFDVNDGPDGHLSRFTRTMQTKWWEQYKAPLTSIKPTGKLDVDYTYENNYNINKIKTQYS